MDGHDRGPEAGSSGVALAAAAVTPAHSVPGAATVMPTYARQNVVFDHGEGVWLTSTTGDKYLDFASGVAVNALGHAHPALVAALTEQARKLWHTSNLYRVAGQERLSERLCAATFADMVFFCNSGAEACEGAIKAARRYHATTGAPERWRIITFAGAFHGRTLATLAAGGNPKHLEGFGPEVDGFVHLPFGDHEALNEAAARPDIAAIMIEPVQGEGGVRPVPYQCLDGLRELCDANGLLLVFDEVQTGVGRTGRLFAHQATGIAPDIMAIAKGIGGGFPVGAFLTTRAVGETMSPGSHGSTFGGNPLAMAVANAVLDIVDDEAFLESVRDTAAHLHQSLEGLRDAFPDIVDEVRGSGLLTGLRLKPPAAEVVKAAFAEKLLLVGAGDNVVRILPPLNVTPAELSEGVDRLARAFGSVREAASVGMAPADGAAIRRS